ncbi:hypothetical protein A6V36_37170 [Paraburkholderia ginsengiterrae]|uniref:Uncharacterized protein n=1 Tax=Paraburkholderia ginsengiterrae TaxID=1462993 RepID=A0A1A9MWR8_9BURK|nr:hypothetical protein A6V37_36840 [Paraburkholderia ginsengiterrae]OAJ53326.1 hypothetical protein A6V36_37170 [Paraburkholderia ginsengiterrae]
MAQQFRAEAERQTVEWQLEKLADSHRGVVSALDAWPRRPPVQQQVVRALVQIVDLPDHVI